MKIIERIHNTETNEVTEIERQLTADELLANENEVLAIQERDRKVNEKIAKRTAILEKLGLSQEEAAALLS